MCFIVVIAIEHIEMMMMMIIAEGERNLASDKQYKRNTNKKATKQLLLLNRAQKE